MPGNPFWTAEEDAVLVAQRDRKSTWLIAEMLPGRSKGAVCGRMQRLGMANPNGRITPVEVRPHPQQKTMTAVPDRRKAAPVKKPKPEIAPEPLPLDEIWQPLPDTIPVKLMKLEQRHCRWPVTGGSCGVDTGGSQVYCQTHKAVAQSGTAR